MNNSNLSQVSKNQLFYILLVIFTAALIYAYSNHFNNGFHFDDNHTIVNNEYIREIGNIPSFFTELETFGTMPNNRTYRPVITMFNTIDYWFGGGLNPLPFHISIFLSYIFLGVILYFVLLLLFNQSLDTGHNRIIALCTAAFYMLHTANAETINYIIMRSDSFSTICMVAGLLFYMHKKTRKYQLHLLVIVVGIASKESALMLVPILFCYILLFELDVSLIDVMQLKKNKEVLRALIKSAPSLIVGVLFFWFTRAYFRPEATLLTNPYSDPFEYFITQWCVIAHYLANFIIPIHLSADPDIELIGEFLQHRVIFSGLLIATLLIIAIFASKTRRYRPVTFGILWFFICLLPTSSIIPFGQVSNDHRTFCAYIGLVMACGWFVGIKVGENYERIRQTKYAKYMLILCAFNVMIGHVYGVRQRNEVWNNEESLWYDVAIKSPNNGRGLMNYGLTLMSQAKYDETLKYFQRAMELMPYYSYLHINMGILRNAMGFPEEAEKYYQNSLQYDALNVEAYFFYAKFLAGKNRLPEAIAMAERGLAISPGHFELGIFLKAITTPGLQVMDRAADTNGPPPGGYGDQEYINQSLMHYNRSEFEACITACEKALAINPNSKEAYNNICTANIKLNRIEAAIKAGQQALAIDPEFQLAKNNLAWAYSLKSK